MSNRNSYFTKLKEDNPELPARVGVFWSDEEETRLLQLVQKGNTPDEIGKILERTTGSITSRLKHIAIEMFSKGIAEENILEVTHIDKEELLSAIAKYNDAKIAKERKKEEKFMKSPPKAPATLVTIPTSDIMQMKLLLFEIRDLLKVIAEK